MRRGEGLTLFKLIYNVLIVVVSVFILFRGFMVDDEDLRQPVRTAGYTDVGIIDKTRVFSWTAGCDSGEAVAADIKAKNAKGEVVDLIVCRGWPFKGATVRYP